MTWGNQTRGRKYQLGFSEAHPSEHDDGPPLEGCAFGE